jgi:hypothetical protein
MHEVVLEHTKVSTTNALSSASWSVNHQSAHSQSANVHTLLCGVALPHATAILTLTRWALFLLWQNAGELFSRSHLIVLVLLSDLWAARAARQRADEGDGEARRTEAMSARRGTQAAASRGRKPWGKAGGVIQSGAKRS